MFRNGKWVATYLVILNRCTVDQRNIQCTMKHFYLLFNILVETVRHLRFKYFFALESYEIILKDAVYLSNLSKPSEFQKYYLSFYSIQLSI